MTNKKSPNIDIEYQNLIREVLSQGNFKSDRTGTGTISKFGCQIKHDMSIGFPLLTTKRVSLRNAAIELWWISNGRTDLKYLTDHGVKYWEPDYKRSGRTDGTLGPIYGHQWRNFNGVDQLKNLLYTLRDNPTDRRMIVSAWNPADLDEMALPPCHYGFQVYVNNNKLDLLWTQRSVDIFLGLPYDIAMYGLLLLQLAHTFGYKPGVLTGQFGDCHLYSNHIEQANMVLGRQPFNSPHVLVNGKFDFSGSEVTTPQNNNYELMFYIHHPHIPAELSVGT
ncbi:MAG: thymidylate synthase [candidate division WOR-3 bacterium]|nr:thymidylate synthase [candidate division WOR-3 bacterium]